jgi:hypothetical protein
LDLSTEDPGDYLLPLMIEAIVMMSLKTGMSVKNVSPVGAQKNSVMVSSAIMW